MAHVLIIGASRGIGLALAHAYHQAGDTVTGTTRDPDRADALRAVANVEALDSTSDASVADLARRLEGVPVDVLIYNAGILQRGGLQDATSASLLEQFDLNAVGALRVVQSLRRNLAISRQPRIGLMSSRMGSIADNTSGGAYGYRASKAALNAIGRSLAHDLAPMPVLLLHPGFVRTELTGGAGDVEPEQAAQSLKALLDGATTRQSGRLWHRDGYELPW